MKSSYTGVWVQRLENGEIHTVKVYDTAGNGNSIDPEIYIERNCQPPIEELPDFENYQSESIMTYTVKDYKKAFKNFDNGFRTGTYKTPIRWYVMNPANDCYYPAKEIWASILGVDTLDIHTNDAKSGLKGLGLTVNKIEQDNKSGI